MLRTLLEQLVPQLQRIGWSPERHAEADESHARLYSALVAGDIEVAQNEIRVHLQFAYNALLKQTSTPPTVPATQSREEN